MQDADLYRCRGYVEFGRFDDSPVGYAHKHFVKPLVDEPERESPI